MTTADATPPRWVVEPGVATGIGSLPGTDATEAARLVVDEFPDLPHIAELPARGPGAGMIGRTAALLVELAVDLQPAGWRLVDRPGADLRRATSFVRQDLDILEETLDGYRGLLKLQVTGPWTLAAQIEKTRGDKVVGDHGARRDLASSLAEGVAAHVAEVARRVPGATVVAQLDEPGLPTVLAGDVPTMSGFGRLRAIDASEVEFTLRAMVERLGVPVIIHCCAYDVPVALLRRTKPAAIAFDLAVHPRRHDQVAEVAEAVEAGIVVLAGVVPSAPADAAGTVLPGSVGSMRAQVTAFWRRLDQPPDALPTSVIVTPACGLAAASPAYAVAAMRRARAVARALTDDPES